MEYASRNNFVSGVTGIALLIAVCVSVAVASTRTFDRGHTPEQVGAALDFVEKLLSVSSLAKDIEAEHFAPAMAYLAEARRLHAEAVKGLAANELESAMARRDEAIRLAFEAGHLTQMARQQKDKPRNDFEHRLRSVNALLSAHTAIATKQGHKELITELEGKIHNDLERAKRLQAAEDYENGMVALNAVYEEVRSGVAAIRGGEPAGLPISVAHEHSPYATEYDTKLHSINALLEAQQRIADEKIGKKEKESLNRTVTTLLETANEHAMKNDYEHAMAALNQAYLIVASSIEHMRGGETLVRSLHFNSPEEEYHYELDRYNTYQMLIKKLTEDQKTMEITARVQQFLDQAAALRKLAEKQATSGEFTEAIKTMEQATQNLIFAMRNAGFFIPG